jgi:RNA polymerase sigma-70 factor, ECF subfamily
VASDEELMASAAQGNTSAFEQIVLRYQASVWRVAYRFCGNSADAQDIGQIAFLKLFETAARYRPAALLKTYLFRIVHTTCIDHARKKKPVASDDPADISDDSSSAIEYMIRRERDETIRRSIEKLPVRQKSAVILRYEAELPIRAIANIMKISEKAAERLLAHARSALRPGFKKMN